MGTDRACPFVVDRWVRGDELYVRRAEVAEILDGPRDLLWIVGSRRIGKTSLLRHVESTHILRDVELLCDRVGIIPEGKLRDVGPLRALLSPRVLETAPEATRTVCACEPVLDAELRHVARAEGLRKLTDCTLRVRLGVGACQGAGCAASAAGVLAEELGWDAPRAMREVAELSRAALARSRARAGRSAGGRDGDPSESVAAGRQNLRAGVQRVVTKHGEPAATVTISDRV